MNAETFRQALAIINQLGYTVAEPADNWPRPWGTRQKAIKFKDVMKKFNGMKERENNGNHPLLEPKSTS